MVLVYVVQGLLDFEHRLVDVHAVHSGYTLLIVQLRKDPRKLPHQIQIVHIHLPQQFFKKIRLIFCTIHGLDHIFQKIVFKQKLAAFNYLEESLLWACGVIDGVICLLVRSVVHHDVLIEGYGF